MKIAVFSTRSYDREFLSAAAEAAASFSAAFNFFFYDVHLQPETLHLAKGYDAVCCFVNDQLDRTALKTLKSGGTRLVALRCAGYNNVDLIAAGELGIPVVRVPAYSPEAVAEHTVALILALNRKIYRAYRQVREGNFSLEGLVGFNLHGKIVGLIGTGRIGKAVAKILEPGFGCKLLGYDLEPNQECRDLGVEYFSLAEVLANSDVVSLHAPLVPATVHLINEQTIALMKKGVMLINTSRGGLVDTQAVIGAVKTAKIGYLGLDVYEEETELFFEDFSLEVISDDVFSRLLTFPNVVITGHQGFLTREALQHIAQTTLENFVEFASTGTCRNQVRA
ncbi:MAG TPA: 2-hydroxyacid dehydrogenase [Chthoniobacterales bacterium]|jgi:D-lactate dehydrogenase|nr:2-hydroxyacid dehydrogenase [Chthoniobacterales bacterium]